VTTTDWRIVVRPRLLALCALAAVGTASAAFFTSRPLPHCRVLVRTEARRRGTGSALFAALSAKPPADAAVLPVIDDRRAASTSADATSTADAVVGLTVGAQIDPVDLDAATRLASLAPGDIGSSAVSLSVSVTDENGFVVGTKPGSWSAVFGFYTPSLRTTEMIPGQVRLLRSLLIGREPVVDRIILASETDGTYTPRAASSGSPKASVAP